MAFELHRYQFQQEFAAASTYAPFTVVSLDTTTEKQVVSAANASQRPFGVIGASAGQGRAVTVYEEGNIVKCIAAASIGANAEVAVASLGVSSQVQGGTTLATTTLLGLASGAAASGKVQWAVGLSETAALAGEIFSVLIKPRQLSGLV
jgi:hypothetical protein